MVGVLALLLACSEEDTVEYEQLNSSEDALDIQVGLLEEAEAQTVELNSNTGAFVIGTATVEPGGGPVGTLHTITIVITDEDVANRIERVSILADSQGRPNEEFDLVADSADESFFLKEILSVGDSDEQRTDIFYLRVWDSVEPATSDTGQ